ncbi:MAG: hypothetical protein ACRD12_14780 [Acidimicrobiales bacterium]
MKEHGTRPAGRRIVLGTLLAGLTLVGAATLLFPRGGEAAPPPEVRQRLQAMRASHLAGGVDLGDLDDGDQCQDWLVGYAPWEAPIPGDPSIERMAEAQRRGFPSPLAIERNRELDSLPWEPGKPLDANSDIIPCELVELIPLDPQTLRPMPRGSVPSNSPMATTPTAAAPAAGATTTTTLRAAATTAPASTTSTRKSS